jgi:hypothetical protein
VPSLLHEGLLALVREKPAFAAEVLRDLLRVPVPAFTSATLADATSKKGVPVDYTADAVVVLLGGRKPVFAVVVEVQLRPKPDKLFTWPLYAVDQRSRHRCPVVVLVVTPSTATARWAAQPIELGGGTWRTLVVGPKGVPVVIDVELAKREPHLATLSLLTHGRDRDVSVVVAIATAAIAGAEPLPEGEKMLHFQLIESSLGGAARKALEMLPQGQRVFSANFAKGKAKGLAEGRAEGKADAILLVLRSRGLPVSAEQRQRILDCTRATTLDSWLKKAATVRSVGQLLAGGRKTA